MARLKPEQQRVLQELIAVSRTVKDPRLRSLVLRAGAQTGKVETNYRNLNYGDADSKGWRQERASLYDDPTNLPASMRRFRDEVIAQAKKNPGAKSWEIAAAVQRPREDLRGRYRDEARASWADLQSVLGGRDVGSDTSESSASPASGGSAAAAIAALGLDRPALPSAAPSAPSFSAQAPQAQGAPMAGAIPASTPVAPKPDIGDALQLLAAGSRNQTTGEPDAELPEQSGGRAGKGLAEPVEAFYDPVGSFDNGKFGQAIGGHSDHVHVAAPSKKVLGQYEQLAKHLGLTITSTTGGKHVAGSFHYKGLAADVAGDPRKMAAFYKRVTGR